MKQPLTYLILISFLFTTGCWSKQVSNNPLAKENTEQMTVLFSDENSIYEEASFYDALLEMQRLYPEYQFPFQIVYASDRDVIRYFNITTYPTMIVFNGDEIELRIEGVHAKDDIIKKLTEVLNPQLIKKLKN